jgi:hypothetical protein
MGEFADDAVNMAMDVWLSDLDNPYLETEGGRHRAKRCRYCDEYGFHWEETPTGWRLFDSKGQMHSCLTKEKVND